MLSRDEVLSHLSVSRETSQRLDSYVQLLERWQKSINLVAPSTIPQVWHRHILDCAQLAKLHLDRPHWVDLGAGAGLPGIVVAILRQEAYPAFNLHLVESNGKKCAFLREAIRICGVSAQIHDMRIESALPTVFPEPNIWKHTVVSARALASLEQLLSYSSFALNHGAGAVFMKGIEAQSELTEAQKSWHIDAELIPSVTEPDARIVLIRQARHR